MLAYYRNTNYSVVDLDLIDELYRRSYAEKVSGVERLRMLNVSRVLGVHDDGDGVSVRLCFLPTGEVSTIEADAVVCATGYRERDPRALLGEAGEHCRTGETGELLVERDYRVATDPGQRWGVYLQGATEDTHGIASSLLSMTAVRTGEIVRSIAGRSARVPQGSRTLTGTPALLLDEGRRPLGGRTSPAGAARDRIDTERDRLRDLCVST